MKRSLAAGLALALFISSSHARADEPPQADDAASSDSTPPNWARIGGVASVVAGAGFLGLFTASFLQVAAVDDDERYVAYRQSHPGSVDVCEDAAAGSSSEDRHVAGLCSKASTYEVLQVVSIPAAALAITGGILLIARSGEADAKQARRPVDVVAGYEKGGGRLGLVGRF